MKLVFSAFRMGAVGGSETYVLTVAEHLQALGHDVTVHATESGEAAGIARDPRIVFTGHVAASPSEPRIWHAFANAAQPLRS